MEMLALQLESAPGSLQLEKDCTQPLTNNFQKLSPNERGNQRTNSALGFVGSPRCKGERDQGLVPLPAHPSRCVFPSSL